MRIYFFTTGKTNYLLLMDIQYQISPQWTIERLKAQFVIEDYTQTYGVDYF